MTNRMLRAALGYAKAGWHVFPIWHPVANVCACKDGAECERPAKHPVGYLVHHGLGDATSSPGPVHNWWNRLPLANIALRTGAESGVWVLDVDANKDGFSSLDKLSREVGLPDTLTAESGGGGLHLFFRHQGGKVVTRTQSLGPGLDIRGDGGYLLLSPSLHISGRRYRWTNRAPIAAAPVALLERVLAPPEPLPAPPIRYAVPDNVELRATRYLATLPPAVSGQNGSTATFKAALHLVKGFALPDSVALELLMREYNPRCLPPWSRRELMHKVKSAAKSQTATGYLLGAA